MIKTYPLPEYIQRFFTERLMAQLNVSPNTIASYRDTFRLLIQYCTDNLNTLPTDLHLHQIDEQLIGRFLMYCEEERGNTARSRNIRLAAIKSFYKYVSSYEPQVLLLCQKILAMPSKRFTKKPIDYLEPHEIEAVLAAPNTTTWFGRRDRILMLFMIQTGLRVSECLSLKVNDIKFGVGAHVTCLGKGRKERSTPLRKDCCQLIKAWTQENSSPPKSPLFSTQVGKQLSRDAVERLVHKHASKASKQCPSLSNKKVTPHVLRHTAAMQLLQNGVDRTIIALWLGHESVDTTLMYLHADLKQKEKAMKRTSETAITGDLERYLPKDDLLMFLENL